MAQYQENTWVIKKLGDIYINRALASDNTTDYQKGMSQAEELFRKLNGETKASALADLADHYSRKNQLDKALDIYEEVYSSFPDTLNSFSLIKMGDIYRGEQYGKKKDIDGILELYLQALHKGGEAYPIYNIAREYSKIDIEKSIDIYNKIIGYNDDITAIKELGLLYEKNNRFKDAIDLYTKVALQSDNDFAWISLMKLADKYEIGNEVDKNEDQAKFIYEYVLSNKKDSDGNLIGTKYFTEIAKYYINDNKDINRAKKLLLRSVWEQNDNDRPTLETQYFPSKDAEGYQLLGQIHENMSQLDTAEKYYNKAIPHADNTYVLREAFAGLGRVHEVRGNFDQAKYNYTQANQWGFSLDLFKLAKKYHYGSPDLKKNLSSAIEIYKILSDSGDLKASVALGVIYKYEDPKDLQLSDEYFSKVGLFSILEDEAKNIFNEKKYPNYEEISLDLLKKCISKGEVKAFKTIKNTLGIDINNNPDVMEILNSTYANLLEEELNFYNLSNYELLADEYELIGDTNKLESIYKTIDNLAKVEGAEYYFTKLGDFYKKRGIHQKAKEFYIKALDNGDRSVFVYLGELAETNNQIEDAIKYYDESSKDGNLDSMYLLANLYSRINKREDFFQTIKSYHEKNLSDYRGQSALARAYLLGYGVEPNDKEAFSIYEKLAKSPQTIWVLTQMADELRKKEEVSTQEINFSNKLYKMAADANDTRAQLILGKLYETGTNGLSQDLNTAFKYYNLAAEQDNLWGLIRIFDMYDTNRIQNEKINNKNNPLHLYNKAIEIAESKKEDLWSILLVLSNEYLIGDGKTINRKRSDELFEKALSLAVGTDELEKIYEMYDKGINGVHQDNERAKIITEKIKQTQSIMQQYQR